MSALTILLLAFFNHKYGFSMKMIIVSHLVGAGLITLHIMLEKKAIKVNVISRILMVFGVLSYGIYAWHGFLSMNKIFLENMFFIC